MPALSWKATSDRNNPNYHEFRKAGEFNSAAETFIFIEEHPDSINDGYFLNRAANPVWNDLPASWHNGAANLSYGDGHCEPHRWVDAITRRPQAAGCCRLTARPAAVQRLRFLLAPLPRPPHPLLTRVRSLQ